MSHSLNQRLVGNPTFNPVYSRPKSFDFKKFLTDDNFLIISSSKVEQMSNSKKILPRPPIQSIHFLISSDEFDYFDRALKKEPVYNFIHLTNRPIRQKFPFQNFHTYILQGMPWQVQLWVSRQGKRVVCHSVGKPIGAFDCKTNKRSSGINP